MQNYFNYYTEIEEHFQRRRGSLRMLSTLDWALIATWQEAGFPLEAVLRGIDAAFEKHATRAAKGRIRRINGLAYCAQAVLRAVEEMHEAATGAARKKSTPENSGFENQRIAEFLRQTAEALQMAKPTERLQSVLRDTVQHLRNFAAAIKPAEATSPAISIESLEQNLVALEDRIFAALQTFTPAENLMALREQSARELAPCRSRLNATQIRQIEQQFLRRSLFEQNKLPRLSLFYMRTA